LEKQAQLGGKPIRSGQFVDVVLPRFGDIAPFLQPHKNTPTF